MPPEQDFVRALTRRVRLAVTEAERVVARSQALVSMRRVLTDGQLLVCRCAWCERFTAGGEWVPESGLPGFVPKRALETATHTICPDCEEKLVDEGKSHAHRS